MAETINIKLLIDAAQSAKTVAETRKALKDLRSAALQVEEGSAAFQQINVAAGQLQDKIGDLQATTKFFANDLRQLEGLTGIATGIAGGFALAQGAIQLFGAENDRLNESLIKLNAVMAILNGLQSIGMVIQKESAAMLFIQNNTRKLAIALTSEQAAAEAAEAVAAGTATIAQRALNAAMSANPIGILITLLAAGTAALIAFSGKSEKAEKEEKKRAEAIKASNDAMKERDQFVAKESQNFSMLIYQLAATNAGSKERLDLIKQINTTYGTTLQNLSDETKFQAALNMALEDYITLQYNNFKLKKNAEWMEKQNEKQFNAEQKLLKIRKDTQMNMAMSELARKVALGDANAEFEYSIYLQKKYPDTSREKIREYQQVVDIKNAIAEQNKIIEESEAAKRRLGLAANQLTQSNNELTEGGKKYVVQTKSNTKATDDNTKALDLNAEALETVADAETFLTEQRLEDEAEILELMEDGLKKRLRLLEIDRKQAIFENEKKYKSQIEAIDNVLKKEKEGGTLSVENQKKLNDEKTKLEKEQGVQETQITDRFEKEKTKIVLEEEKKRATAAKAAAKAILTQEEYTNFIMFLQKQLGTLDDLLETNKVKDIFKELGDNSQDAAKGLQLFSDAFIENADKLFEQNQPSGKFRKALEKFLELPKEAVDNTTLALVEALKENRNLLTKAIDEYDALLFKGGLDDLTGKIFELDDDDATQYTLKLTSFYQDKFNIIKKFEDEINAEVGRTQSFAVFPEAGQIGLPELDAEKANKLEQQLQERYEKLKNIENQYYQDSLFALFQNFEDGQLTAIQFNREYEKLQEKHNDNLLDIDLVYGQASQVELKERTIRKNEERIALQQKLNQELLNLEQDLQDAIMELFERRMDAQNRAAQERYDAEIERIDAEEQKYKDSLDNRSAAEQAQLDVERGFDEQRKNAADRLAIEQDAIRQRQFNAEKANDAITIAIQTAVAVAKTIAELGGVGAITPAGIALIAAIVAQGAISEALVLSKQFVPAFAEGGLISGPGTGTSDSIVARVSNGESVINAKSTRMFAPLLSAINQAGGGRAIPSFANGGIVNVSPTQVSQSMDNFEKLEKAIYSISERPIETYVKQTVVTNAQDTARKIKKRTTFG